MTDDEYRQITIDYKQFSNFDDKEAVAAALERRFTAFVEWSRFRDVDILTYTEPTDGDLRMQFDITTSLKPEYPVDETASALEYANDIIADISRSLAINGTDSPSPWEDQTDD